VKQGKFREDLYYRLNVVPVSMPSLRERLGDVPALVEHFIEKICWQEGLPRKLIRKETLDRLCCLPWPGNVRQLENAVEMAIALSGDREVLYSSDFPSPPDIHTKPVRAASSLGIAIPDHGLDFEGAMRNIERNTLDQALRKAGGNKQRAADMLQMKRTTLSAKLRSLDARTVCAR
jgi:DNA-binding NtrC family response regulator